MYSLSNSSSKNLSTCHPIIQKIFKKVLDIVDYTVVCGHRGEIEQNEMFESRPRRSKKKWPDSKHNTNPSLAIDVYPYLNGRMINGDLDVDIKQMIYFAGIVKGVANSMGYVIRWGGDWDGKTKLNSKGTFNDLPHYEVIL